ncbi:MAG: PstS family phosphate ABC transporter substrate-binding protein [Opitutales bacterium]
MNRLPFLAVLALLAVAVHSTAVADSPGVLRVAGNAQLQTLVDRWAADFRATHPHVRVETHLTGSDTGLAALYTGRADLALLGRSPTDSEIQAFEWIHGYKPSHVEIATGSAGRPGKSPALVLFVGRDNPLRQLSLTQLDALFGTEHRYRPQNIRTWDQLGLTGKWAGQPIHLYTPDAMSGSGRFFRHVVLGDSRMMAWSQLTEFRDTALTGPGADDAGRKVIAALAHDRLGLAVASLGDADDRVRPLALAADDDSTPVAATAETVANRSYPLSRAVLACFNRPTGAAPNPLVADFLRLILSARGARAVTPDTGYLPLPAPLAGAQLSKIK